MKSIKFAVVQSGYCVFGTGHTRDDAVADACKWLEPNHETGEAYTPDSLEIELDEAQFHGDLILLTSDDDEFDSYLTNQGGFVKRRGKWFSAD